MALLERDPLLRELAALLGPARHGRGRLVLVAGEAGIGKTSLAEAFCQSAGRTARVLWGTCDPLVPPRPFTPILDIADIVGGELRRAVVGGDRDAVHDAFLGLLRRVEAPPAVVVLDDLHWADDATLDLLQVLGRRVDRMRALVIGTYRDHEVGADHPLRLALGAVPAAAIVELHVPPLSLAAVERLAGDRAAAIALHEATAGNSFFVTEALAAGDRLPSTIRDAVLARVARLSPDGRRVVDAAAILGPGCEAAWVLDVAGARRDALDECLDRGLLRMAEGAISFRHELARVAVLDAQPPSLRAASHARALATLRTRTPADWPRLARHAAGADDTAAVAELAPRAAHAAEAVGAHREAAAFFGAAAAIGGGLEPTERGELHERHGHARYLCGQIPVAIEAQRAALGIWRTLGDRRREGACLTELSQLLWLTGAGDAALEAAERARDLLEAAAPGTAELAWAWAVLAQRHMVEGRDGLAAAATDRALALAEPMGLERVAVHALTTAAVVRIFGGADGGWSMLESAAARGRVAGLEEEAARALINLVEAARDLRRYDLVAGYLPEAEAFLDQREMGLYTQLLQTRIAALEVDVGRWASARARVDELLGRSSPPVLVRVRALTVAGQIAARRGLPDAWASLDAALELVGNEFQDLAQLLAARAEAAWLGGDLERARAEARQGLDLADHGISPWWWSELAFWGWKAGAAGPHPHPTERPYWLHVRGRHGEAAAAWQAVGAPYQRALALADSDDVNDLRVALDICHDLGARPLARMIAHRLDGLGAARISRGPRTTTLANPGQLTDRQLEVLDLLVAGLGNSDIASRLVLSPKTVDHHVSAVLRKLGARDRRAAAVMAADLGIFAPPDQDGESAGPR